MTPAADHELRQLRSRLDPADPIGVLLDVYFQDGDPAIGSAIVRRIASEIAKRGGDDHEPSPLR